MPRKHACRHTTVMVLRYLIIQMAETSASGLGASEVILRVSPDPLVGPLFLI